MNVLIRLANICVRWAAHKTIPTKIHTPKTCMLLFLKRILSSYVNGRFSCSRGAILKMHSHSNADARKNSPEKMLSSLAIHPDAARHRALVSANDRKHLE